MEDCNKCGNRNVVIKQTYKYHDIYECLTCGNWAFKPISDCCRNPFEIITKDHKETAPSPLYKQCINCGGCLNRSKALASKKYGNEVRKAFSNSRFEEWKKEKNDENKNLWESKQKYNYLNSPYYKYIQYILYSDVWKHKREQAFERDNYQCQLCKDAPAEEAHHLTYANLFNEPLEDLQSLCILCHKETHRKMILEFNNAEQLLRQNR